MGVLVFCADQKAYGKYEGTWYRGKQDGCGIFTWPNGTKTMRQYNEGVLVSERDVTAESQFVNFVYDNFKKLENTISQLDEKLSKSSLDEDLINSSVQAKMSQWEEKMSAIDAKKDENGMDALKDQVPSIISAFEIKQQQKEKQLEKLEDKVKEWDQGEKKKTTDKI